MTFGPVKYSSPASTFVTRGYQKSGGYMTGPIIRVKAGETFQVSLINALTADDNTPHGADINLPHLPNSTNLHTVRLQQRSRCCPFSVDLIMILVSASCV